MMKSLQLGLVTLGALVTFFALAEDPEPRIPPGYEPESDVTEQGLWMELKDYEAALQRSALLVKNEEINDYVNDVTCQVTGAYCADLRVYVVKNPNFNASMTANGVMVIWTGLLIRLSSEDELAAVIGHELSHYTQLHVMDRFSRIKKAMAAGSILDLGLFVFTGNPVPVGQLAALADVMAYSREQEEEADYLGVSFMTDAGYDPSGAVEVWKMIVEEEKAAFVKNRKPGVFTKTHPASEDRILNLREYIAKNYPGSKEGDRKVSRHVALLENHYMYLMEGQIDTNRFGRTKAILENHREIGIEGGLVHFFQGEMYRQRNGEGDMSLAMNEYLKATETTPGVPEAHLNLGYLYQKSGDQLRARNHFTAYLELKPAADDRAMVEFYLQEGAQ